MWLFWVAILLTLVLVGVWLLHAWERRLSGDLLDERETYLGLQLEWGRQGLRFTDCQDPLQLEFEREERVARENFERRHAMYPQCFYAEGQTRSK